MPTSVIIFKIKVKTKQKACIPIDNTGIHAFLIMSMAQRSWRHLVLFDISLKALLLKGYTCFPDKLLLH